MTLLCLLLALQPIPLMVLDAPPCRIYHPPSLRTEAEEIASHASGTVERLRRELSLPVPRPFRLYLVSQDEATGGEIEGLGALSDVMPDWAAGVAYPGADTAIIGIDRIGRYGQRQLLSVFAHETVHLLMGPSIEASRQPGSVPRWFREGVASNLARDGEWLDFVYLWLSPVATSRQPLTTLEEAFVSTDLPAMRRTAYAGSYSLVRFAIDKHGEDFPARVLAGLRAGLVFDAAWARAGGTSYFLDASEWSSTTRGGRRWMAIITSSFTLWTVISVLFLLAYQAKRRRARRMLERWEEEEQPGGL